LSSSPDTWFIHRQTAFTCALPRRNAAGKAQAAREVCAASCPHRRRSPRRAHFVDWYLVLAIGEAASEDAIKRRYRHLALQLHPDKNRHPKAEVAFKLVSEAHACLTDKARRRAFDAERATAFCAACHDRARAATTPCAPTRRRASDRRTPASSEAASAQQQHNKARGSVAKQQGGGRRRPPSPTTQALREVQNRLRDECRVIDGCLRANAAGARRRQSFPLFDPSDRQRFPDYPHARPPPSFAECRPFEEEEELGAGHGHQSWCTNGSCESPVYQVRTAPERAARTNRPW
uniref:J domain-containing protein n=1 Tax=Aegilops tauschii subsp. strangulata TaxID=200361 RepID=A0A453MBY0_AEGTS